MSAFVDVVIVVVKAGVPLRFWLKQGKEKRRQQGKQTTGRDLRKARKRLSRQNPTKKVRIFENNYQNSTGSM